jgi:hypothetical protein
VRVTPILKRVQALGGYGTWPLMARPGARRAARGGCLVGAGDGPRSPQRSASGCCSEACSATCGVRLIRRTSAADMRAPTFQAERGYVGHH